MQKLQGPLDPERVLDEIMCRAFTLTLKGPAIGGSVDSHRDYRVVR